MTDVIISVDVDPTKALQSTRVIRRELADIDNEAKAKAKSIKQNLGGLEGAAAKIGLGSSGSLAATLKKMFDRLGKLGQSALGSIQDAAKKLGDDVLKQGQRALDGLKSELKKVGPLLKKVGGFVLKKIALAATIIKAGSFVKETVDDFLGAIDDFQRISQLGGKALERRIKQARGLAKDTGLSGAETLNTFTAIIDENKSLLKKPGGLGTVADAGIKLGAATKTSPVVASGGLANALNNFGAGPNQADRFAAILGANAREVPLKDILRTLDELGPIAKNAGVSFADINAQIQILNKRGIGAVDAGTGLGKVFSELEKGALETKPSVQGLTQSFINLRKPTQANADLREKLEKEAPGILKILIDNANKTQTISKKLKGAPTIDDQVRNNTDFSSIDLKKFMNKFRRSIEGAILPFAKKLNPTTSAGINSALDNVFNKMRDLGEDRDDLAFGLKRNSQDGRGIKASQASQAIFKIDSALERLDIRAERLFEKLNKLNQTSSINNVIDGEARRGAALRESGITTQEVLTITTEYGQTLNGLGAQQVLVTENTATLSAAVEKNRTAFDKMAGAANRADVSLGNVKIKAKETKTALDTLSEASDKLGQAVGSAFENAVINGKDLRSVLRGLENDLLRILFKEFGVTGKGGIFSTIIKDVTGVLKGGDKTTITGAAKRPGDDHGTFGTFENDVQVPGMDSDAFNALSAAMKGLTVDFGLTSSASKTIGSALQTSATDALFATAKTTLLGAAEQSAATSIFELAAAARVASAALNSVGGSKGGGLGGLGGIFGGGGGIGLDSSGLDFQGFGGTVGGFVGPFAKGGSFLARGPAGIDNLVAPLRISAGERVTVETPAQQKANDNGGNQRPIMVVMNITTPDTGGFRKSQNQIVADLQRALDRARKIQ